MKPCGQAHTLEAIQAPPFLHPSLQNAAKCKIQCMGKRITLSNPAGGHSLPAGWHRTPPVRHRVRRLPSPKDRGHKEMVYGPPASLARWADKLQKEIRVNHLKTTAPICAPSHALGSNERHLPLEQTLPRAVLVCSAAQIKA